ncbi:MAG: D-alanyl-D-alanine carboxypeptidase/D-alanyl-D-alanine-endopeptidase [Actinomycetales bacterium]
MRRRLLIGGSVLVALLAGYAVADAEDAVPGVLTLSPRVAAVDPAPPTPSATYPPTSTLGPVLADPSAAAPLPVPSVLAARLAATTKAFGSGGGASVVDALTGQVLYSTRGSTPHTPASTTKLLTAVATLSAMSPDMTLPTKVVQGTTAGQVVLVGGGDTQLAVGKGSPTAVLGRAGLGDLAMMTAKSLQDKGVQAVSVGFDDSMFSGPTLNPRWVSSDWRLGMVGPVTALGLASRASRFGHAAPADPSLATAQVFVTALRRAGVSVTGAPTRMVAAASAATLGVVQSAPLGDLVSWTLLTSDNTEAEVLARLAAHAAGGVGSFAGAAAHDVHVAAELGVPVAGIRLYDGSGLARSDLIAPQTLTALLAKAAGSGRPQLRPLFSGLPVAGFSGTLVHRFDDRSTALAAGVTRAKTGTLKGVNTLAGVTVDADGRLLAFAFMADHRTAAQGSAADLVDRAAAVLAACGCR